MYNKTNFLLTFASPFLGFGMDNIIYVMFYNMQSS